MKLLIQGIILSLSFIAASAACGGVFTAMSGSFITPRYPRKYPNKAKCTYTFDTGYPITITCPVFKLQRENKKGCGRDYLEIEDSGNRATYCGTSGPKDYSSTTSNVTVTFKSNGKVKKTGFSCIYNSRTTSTTTTTTSTITPTSTSSTISTITTLPDLLQSALDLYNNNICYTRRRSTCGCTVSAGDSEYYTTTSGSYRIVAANGIPDHVFEEGINSSNSNNACPHEVFMTVPLNPTKGTRYTTYELGPVGIAISGGFLYSHYGTSSGNLAVVNSGESFDSCNGHSDANCRYHYHMLPVCIAGEGTCAFVGYMRDGFSVYTYCTHETESRYLKSCYYLKDGEAGTHASHYTYNRRAYNNGDCDLDKANGYTFSDERGYSYIFTEDYPFIMAGYYGTELSSICYLEDA